MINVTLIHNEERKKGEEGRGKEGGEGEKEEEEGRSGEKEYFNSGILATNKDEGFGKGHGEDIARVTSDGDEALITLQIPYLFISFLLLFERRGREKG